MQYYEKFLLVVSIVFFLFILIFTFLDKRPFSRLLFNAILGVGALGIIDLSAKFTGVFIPINLYTVASSAVFSVPAVCLHLILQLIII